MGGITPVCLLLLLWAGVTVSTRLDLQKRIVGGQTCNDNERLYHVKLKSQNGTHVASCGGSLISNQWILTARHCWEDGTGWIVTAFVGVHPGTGPVTEENIIHHEIYNPNNEYHDIMLLKLANPTNIHPVQLPDCTATPRVPLGAEVQIAGYAATTRDSNAGASPTLQCAKTTVVNCPTLSSKTYKFCGRDITVQPTVATCPGDSGGGVVYKDRIYGVIRGETGGGCVRPIFVDVCKYINWINPIINGP